ncbi:MAG: DNA repair protein RadA [Acidobacteriota bacterium]
MAKRDTFYVCGACAHRSPKWLGRCPSCGAWDAYVEEVAAGGSRAGGGKSSRGGLRPRVDAARPMALGAVDTDEAARFSSGLELVDRVLGGGLVPGAAVLLAGEPGIGKSTLLLQVGDALADSAGGRGEADRGRDVLYVTAEESPRQLRLRAERLGCRPDDDGRGQLQVVGETRLEPVLAALEEAPPGVVLVDSIQALRSADLDGPPGSIGQVRHCADRLVETTKPRRTTLVLVGHVTKEGAIAGPKSLEHLVDTVLTFEGESTSGHRVLRAQKNRFGPTGEVGLFEMRDRGLLEVPDPSRVLLDRRQARRPGSAVAATLHGTRPVLVEVQALTHLSSLPSPRRTAVGLDSARATLLLAVLERFGGVRFAERDVFLNVVGGLSLREPAADLAIAAALLSADSERPLPERAGFFGEVGLLGEVRPVAHAGARLRELAAHGFTRAFVPSLDDLRPPKGLRLVTVDDVAELAGRLLEVQVG